MYYTINIHAVQFSLVQSLSCVLLFVTPCQASLSITNSWSLLKLTSTESGFRNSLDRNAGTRAWAPSWNLTDTYPALPTHAWELWFRL